MFIAKRYPGEPEGRLAELEQHRGVLRASNRRLFVSDPPEDQERGFDVVPERRDDPETFFLVRRRPGLHTLTNCYTIVDDTLVAVQVRLLGFSGGDPVYQHLFRFKDGQWVEEHDTDAFLQDADTLLLMRKA